MPVALATLSTPPRIGGRHPWRWVAILSLSLLIHVVALDVFPHWTIEASEQNSNSAPLRAILLPPAPPPQAAESLPPARPARPASQAPRIPRFSRIPEFVPESLDEAIAHVDVSVRGRGSPITQAPVSPDSSGASVTQNPSPSVPADKASTPPPPEALAPVSARLAYKVVAIERKNADPVSPLTYYGVGKIAWASEDGRYRSDLTAAVDFLLFKVNVLASHSEGAVIAAGLAPDRYTETPRKRSTVATNFNRDARQSISFSSSAATMPLIAGVQDRLSVLFQIGALLRANPNLATMGGHVDIPVAGVRGDVETWVFDTQGIETIDVGPGPLLTAHLRRVPKPGSNDKTIDIWIAHTDGGYPARVLYTEPDGSTIEMTLASIEVTS